MQLLTTRNLILAAATLFLLSLLGSCLSMLRPNDSGGMGNDSFGTRDDGYRAIFEILAGLGDSVTRDVAPATAPAGFNDTLTLLSPDPRMVQFSPRYLQALLPWVEGGGRIVIAPRPPEQSWYDEAVADEAKESHAPRDVLEVLGIADQLELPEDPSHKRTSDDQTDSSAKKRHWWDKGRDDESPLDLLKTPIDEPPSRLLSVKCIGSLRPLAQFVAQIAVPGNGPAMLTAKSDKLGGSLICVDSVGNEKLLVAVVPRGKGEIVVVSEPRLWTNALVAKADNSVLAAHLLSPQGSPVVFDEFYHGLSVRGNPLFLLTRPGFAAVSLGLLVGVGCWSWRKAIFLGPPLAQLEPSRRDIAEYIDAMGGFFCGSPDHRTFLVGEIRDGVLRQLSQEMKLPPETTDAGAVVGSLNRRDPGRAQRLQTALNMVDAAKASSTNFPKASFLPILRQLASCL